MEMYADTTSRAGVLEPEGIVEIKFRKAKVLQMMERLDHKYRALKQASADTSLSSEESAKIKAELTAREKVLIPIYSQIAIQFVDLHDRANRMKAKGTIREALEWSQARKYFYWRLRRRLAEEAVVTSLLKVDSGLTRADAVAMLRNIVSADGDDEVVAQDLEQHQAQTVKSQVGLIRRNKVAKDIALLSQSDRNALLEGLKLAFPDTPDLQSVLARLA